MIEDDVAPDREAAKVDQEREAAKVDQEIVAFPADVRMATQSSELGSYVSDDAVRCFRIVLRNVFPDFGQVISGCIIKFDSVYYGLPCLARPSAIISSASLSISSSVE